MGNSLRDQIEKNAGAIALLEEWMRDAKERVIDPEEAKGFAELELIIKLSRGEHVVIPPPESPDYVPIPNGPTEP